MSATDIRTQRFGFGRILAGGWAAFRGYFPAILMVILIVYIPVNAVLNLLPLEEAVDVDGFVAGLRLYWRLMQALEAVFGILATMAIAHIVERGLAGESIAFGPALRQAVSRWLSLIGTNILAGLIILGLTLCLIVPGIIWSVYYTFVTYVVVLRGQGGKRALDYSKTLVKGQWWRVAGISVGLALLVGVASLIVAVPFFFTPDHWLIDIASATLIDVVSALFLTAEAIFFLNLDYLKHPPVEPSGP